MSRKSKHFNDFILSDGRYMKEDSFDNIISTIIVSFLYCSLSSQQKTGINIMVLIGIFSGKSLASDKRFHDKFCTEFQSHALISSFPCLVPLNLTTRIHLSGDHQTCGNHSSANCLIKFYWSCHEMRRHPW